MKEMELPQWMKEKILEKIQNKYLGAKALEYIKLVEKEDGSLIVKETFDKMENHALMFTVLACVNYAQRLLRGESLED